MRQHIGRPVPVMKLSNLVVILDEQRFGEARENQTATSGGNLKTKKAKERQFRISLPVYGILG